VREESEGEELDREGLDRWNDSFFFFFGKNLSGLVEKKKYK
jgi:hypothetical protein